MKRANQILSVLMGMIFIISTNGILIYKTHCVCTGDKQVSLYVMPDSCEEELHVHHTHVNHGCEIETSENNCHECSSVNDECGCESPEVEFFKLVNQISEDDIFFLKIQHEKISVFVASLLKTFEEESENETIEFYTDPPPKQSNSRNFLIEIHQLKIPTLA